MNFKLIDKLNTTTMNMINSKGIQKKKKKLNFQLLINEKYKKNKDKNLPGHY